MDRSEFDRMVGGNLLKYRKARGISQQQLARYLGISFQQVQKYEKGKNSLRLHNIVKLAKLFRCTMEDFCSGRRNPERMTVDEAFNTLHIVFVETLHAVSVAEGMPAAEAEKRCRQIELIGDQMQELKRYLIRKAR